MLGLCRSYFFDVGCFIEALKVRSHVICSVQQTLFLISVVHLGSCISSQSNPGADQITGPIPLEMVGPNLLPSLFWCSLLLV